MSQIRHLAGLMFDDRCWSLEIKLVEQLLK